MIREVSQSVSQSTSIPSGSCVQWSVSGSDSKPNLSICSSRLFQTMGGETEVDPSSLWCLQLGLEWREQLKLGDV